MTSPTAARGPGPLVWSVLAAAAALHLAFNVWIGLDADDTENLETTRVLAAARQFTDGPGALYGPYSGANPCVLIQAPLYYRLTALAAWPIVRAGGDPVAACFATGRAISFLSFLGLLGAAGWLATRGGVPRRAGVLAAILLVGTPIFGSFPVTMRPDVLGVLLQTLGVGGVLVALAADRPRPAPIVLAYLAFAAAFCTKQHYVVGAVVAGLALGRAWWRGRLAARVVLAAHAAAACAVVGYLAIEESVTAGAMSRAVFLLPGDLRRVTAGSWSYLLLVAGEAARRGVGLVLLALAAVWAGRSRPRPVELAAVGFIALELALMAKLCLDSSGAWFNYALQATVVLAILVARRLADRPAGMAPRLAVAAAALAILASDARLVAHGYAFRRAAAAEYRALLADARVAGRPEQARYFPGSLQHYNRRAGSGRLTHDEWLYRAFEAIDEAEPRERWLRRALTDGPVRLVIAEPGRIDDGRLPGVAEPLTDLGFAPAGRVGRLELWERR